MGPSPYLWFLHAKQRLLDQITSLYVCQTSSILLCTQNNVISTRITCLCGSQSSSVVFGCKIANFGPEYKVSMGPGPHLWFLDAKQRLLDQNNKSVWVPDFIYRFGHAKQRDLHQNYKSLWVPDLTCRFVHAKQRA